MKSFYVNSLKINKFFPDSNVGRHHLASDTTWRPPPKYASRAKLIITPQTMQMKL